MPNMTLDYGNLGTFFVAERLPGIQELYTKAHPTIQMLYGTALAGSLNGFAEAKSIAKAVKNPSQTFKDRMLNNTLFFEQAIEYLALTGTVNGPGAQPITNVPSEAFATARWRFNKKETPLAIASDRWRASQNKGSNKEKTNAALNLIAAEAGRALKAQLSEMSSDLFSANTSEAAGLISLGAGVGISTSDTTTYGGVSRSTTTQWRGNYTTATIAGLRDPLNSSYLLTKWGDAIDVLCDNGAQEEDLAIICGTTIFKNYRAIVQGTPSYSIATPIHAGNYNIDKGRNFPFSNLYFGGIPVIRDQSCNTNQTWIVDTKSTIMVGLANSMFDMTDWKLSENVTQEFARLTTISLVVVLHPRRNYNILAS